MVRHSRGAMNIQVRDGLPYVTVTLLPFKTGQK